MLDKHFFLIDDSSNLELIDDPKINIYMKIRKFITENQIKLQSSHLMIEKDRTGITILQIMKDGGGSFCMSIKIAETYGFSKIVHIESDAFDFK